MSETPPSGASPLDAELARAIRRRRIPPVTAALLLVILLAGAFTAGVLVQKHHDRGLAATGTGNLARLFGGRGGATGAGGLGAFGGFGGPVAAAGSAGAGSEASAAGPVVVGSVVRVQGGTVTVRNLGGQTVTVRTTGSTTVSGAASVASLRPGTPVVVVGTLAADGTAIASAIRVTS